MDQSSSPDCCSSASVSLSAIAQLIRTGEPFSPTLVAELWPRVWVWMKFLADYRSCISFLKDSTQIYRVFSFLINYFAESASDLIGMTPGVSSLLTAAWKVLIDVRGTAQEAAYWDVYLLVCRLHTPAQRNLAKMVEGAGGTLHDLASLLCLPSSFADATLPGVHDTYIEALALPHLLDTLEVPPGYPHIRQALKAGLRHLILHRGQKSGAFPRNHTHVRELLTVILPKSTIHYAILSQLRRSLLDVQDIEDSPSFSESDVFAEWTSFKDLARQRLDIMDRYDSGSYISWEACHNENIQCAVVKERGVLRRCSCCRATFYCSPECQSADWREGCHTDMCRVLKSLGVATGREKRDRSFLNVLIHEYRRARGVILMKQTLMMRPELFTPTLVIFDYNTPKQPGDTPRWFFSHPNPPRCLHITKVGRNGAWEGWNFTWSDIGDTMRDELRRISHEIPDGVDAREAFPGHL
ncbi:hypothetical protein B0H11DRAFT_1934934 [Mycena galericulata]|nr:hypothetical protein B0H11DRAFT_1934934 [Mycena galericulata]